MKFAVIPAYEPDGTFPELVRKLKRRDFEIVVVDDGSGVAYAGIFREIETCAHVVMCAANRGKGHALKTAFSWLRERVRDGDTVVTLDCDGQHKPEDAAKLCEAARREPDALYLGSRKQSASSPWRSRFGNAVTRGAFRLATGAAVYDTQTGLRAFSARLLPELLDIPGERYEYELNVLLCCARRGIPIRELSIETVYLDGNASSHFRAVRDSWRICGELVKFSASSLLGFLVDYTLYSLLALAGAAPLAANIAARCVSATVNFHVNRSFVFRDSGAARDSAVKYFALALGILICNSAFLGFFTALLDWNPWVSKLVTEAILFLCGYWAQRRFVFAQTFHCRERECL